MFPILPLLLVLAQPVQPAVAPVPAPVYKLPKPVFDGLMIPAASETIPWGVAATGAPESWAAGVTGKGIRIAILDTGADLTHPDLQSGVVASKDYTGSRHGARDVNGHGTHVAGSIGARKNDKGVVGQAPECEMVILKCLSDEGSGFGTWITQAIYDAVDKYNCQVINMSLGSQQQDIGIIRAITYAVSKGVIVLCAAGNDGPRENTVDFPAAYGNSVCVAAVDNNFNIANFSSRGPAVSIAGHGVQVQSTYPGGKYARMSGTSMGTPNVAGVAVLYAHYCKIKGIECSQAGFLAYLYDTAKKLPLSATWVGHGFAVAKFTFHDKPIKPDVFTLTLDKLTETAAKELRKVWPDFTSFDILAPKRMETKYESVLRRVEAGENVTIEFVEGDHSEIEPGTWNCYLKDGKPMMVKVQPVISNTTRPLFQFQPPCRGGRCPLN